MKEVPFLRRLRDYVPRIHNSMAMLVETPESVSGKPWDFSHYVLVFRVEETGLFLKVDTSNDCLSGNIYGLTGVRTQPHPWGSALILVGPLLWVGTRIQRVTGLTKMAADILPFLDTERILDYNVEWRQITLILPCSSLP